LYLCCTQKNVIMASIKVVLRKKPLQSGAYPISLRITKDRKTKFFKTLFDAHISDWDPNSGTFKNNTKFIQENRLLQKIKTKAFQICSQLQTENEHFTLHDFEMAFRFRSNPVANNFFSFWENLIEDMMVAGRTGNAKANREGYKALKKFNSGTNLRFDEISYAYLSKFENHLRSRGGTDGGISVRMRSIRTVFNVAIARDRISSEIYPFHKYKISKLKSRTNKRALDISEVNGIFDMDMTDHPHLVDSRNYFLFSFYTRGMNFADMLKLKWEDVKSDTILYTRSKTKGNFNIKILPPVQDILDYYKANSIGTEYVFPILLKDGMTPIQIEYRKAKTLTKFNRDLKEIASICKIDKLITSYVARHSFANCLKQKGVATDIISESMGHQNLAVTQAYLKDLDSSVLDDASMLLLERV